MYVEQLREKLTVRETAELIGLNLTLVRTLIQTGKIGSIIVGKKKRYVLPCHIEEYLEKQNKQTPFQKYVKEKKRQSEIKKKTDKILEAHYGKEKYKKIKDKSNQ